MNTNEIRWHLHNYDKLKKDIKSLKEDIMEYQLMDGIKSKTITDMPTCHNGESTVENIICRLDYVEILKNEFDMNKRLLHSINSVYSRLEEPRRTIFEMRYFIMPSPEDVRQKKYNWKEIAEEINYSEDYCKEIDGKIIFAISMKLIKYGYKKPTKYPLTKTAL